MRRRDFIIFLAGVMAAWPLAARAQRKAMPVIGVLSTASPSTSSGPLMGAFRQGLSDAGYVEGRNVAIEYRWADGNYDRLPALAADLVSRKVDLIMANSPPAALAAKSATSTIPIVFRGGTNPVGAGLVASLARPGGNLTGISLSADELTAKRLELLSELVPRAGLIALLVNPNNGSAERVIRDVQEAARTKGLQLHVLKARSESEIDTAFASLVRVHAGALVVAADPFLSSRREQLVALASRHAVPSIYAWREFAASGGLISYGPSLTSAFRLVGAYAGKVLKGAKPADLPVQLPTTFELVINLKTAKALGLTVPRSMLMHAEEVFAQQMREGASGALEHRLPSAFILQDYAEVGGPMSFGAPIIDNCRRAATYVDKIVKGANSSELPVEQPTKYVLVINTKTAKTLGLAIPASVLRRADRVVR